MNNLNIIHIMTELVFQLGIILFAARIGSIVFEKLKLPSILGELISGIIIGPYLLGSIALPGFPHGFFPLYTQTSIPVSPELYSIATIASILLLFMAGLETDLDLLLKFSFSGTVVGIGGIIASFFIGAFTGMVFLHLPFNSPACLMIGIVSTATSVGITARILSQKRKIDSPEGVTILAGAIIDDALGIILLAIVMGIALSIKQDGYMHVEWGHIGLITIKALAVWLSVTGLGLLFANKISSFLKKFKNITTLSILAFGMAIILAGIFEKSGLAMIIGAYVMGLVLSKTDLRYAIQDALHPLHSFFIPIFFSVMGMMVNVRAFASGRILIFGLIYTAGALLAKLIGSGGAALFLNFNTRGALRIGLGMAPRGEVALIIASIGLSYGILNKDIFGALVMMPLLSATITPFFLTRSLDSKKTGVKKEIKTEKTVRTIFRFPSPEITDFVLSMIIQHFNNEGFFVNLMKFKQGIYYIRKENIFIVMTSSSKMIVFDSSNEDVTYIKTIMYEAMLEMHRTIDKLKKLSKPEKMRKTLLSKGRVAKIDIQGILNQDSIIMEMKSETKEQVIKELINVLDKNKKIKNKKVAYNAVMEREVTMSTGMEKGLAFPHAKTNAVKEMVMAIGLKHKGINFKSIDGKPSKIFILILSPKAVSGPHIQLLAGLASILKEKQARSQLLSCKNKKEVWLFFSHKKNKNIWKL